MTTDDALRAAGGTAARWLPFLRQTQVSSRAPVLYCLPHAGAGASVYRSWVGALPGIAVVPVQLPAREGRFQDEPYERMAALVGDLAEVVLAQGRPFALYGHSFGALVAFELLRELRRRGGPDPLHFFVSGFVAPHTRFDDDEPVMGMSEPQLVGLLRDLGGTPEWLLSDPAAVRMLLPAVRADFCVKETYEYYDEPPLTVPITAFASTADPRVREDRIACWREQTLGEFRLHTFTGGHFAVFEQSAATHRHIALALRGASRPLRPLHRGGVRYRR